MSSATARSYVVVGVDGSAASDAAVRWAAAEAAMRALPMKLIHVVAPALGNSTMAPNGTVTSRSNHATSPTSWPHPWPQTQSRTPCRAL
jgi:hypothetical protein